MNLYNQRPTWLDLAHRRLDETFFAAYGWDPGMADDLDKMHRALGVYISVRDQVQLVVKSIETEHIEDENGVPFQIFYGISDNTHAFWSIANAREVIGYAPKDNSQVKFAERITKILAEARKAYPEK